MKPGTIVFRETSELGAGMIELPKAVSRQPYQELRSWGIFFFSGRQGGAVAGVSTRRVRPLVEGRLPLKDMFLSDIFARSSPTIPCTRTHDFLRWRRIIRSLGFTSWLFLWVPSGFSSALPQHKTLKSSPRLQEPAPSSRDPGTF